MNQTKKEMKNRNKIFMQNLFKEHEEKCHKNDNDNDNEDNIVNSYCDEIKSGLKTIKKIERNPNKFQVGHGVPIALTGFAFVSILVNLHNVGLYKFDDMCVFVGIIHGGLAQILAGIFEFFAGSTIGCFAFISYGGFWIILPFTLIGKDIIPSYALANPSTPTSMGFFLLIWTFFTICIFILLMSLQGPNFVQLVFFNGVILFILLTTMEFTQNSTLKFFAGVCGIICGFGALYQALAEVAERSFGFQFFPYSRNIYDLKQTWSLFIEESKLKTKEKFQKLKQKIQKKLKEKKNNN